MQRTLLLPPKSARTLSSGNENSQLQMALLCDHSGIVKQWLHGGIEESHHENETTTFVRLLHESSQVKGLNFFSRLAGKEVITDWDLHFSVAEGVEVLRVAGCWSDQGALVLAGQGPATLKHLCNSIGNAHPQLAESCRRIAAECPPERESVDDTNVYEQLMHVYNDFARMQRDFASQNAELVRLAEEKERLLNVAVHDLRSPLNAISLLASSVSQLATDRLSDHERSMLSRIVDSATEMGESINGLLDSARHRPGEPVIKLIDGDICQLVSNRAELLEALASRKNLTVRINAEHEIPSVPFDKTHFPHVIDNVLGNAIKYSPPGGEIEILLFQDDDYVVVDVCDRGPGLPGGEEHRIFRAFETGSATPTGGEASSGLGLAICDSIVTAHRGNIIARNRVGGGAIFRISLPLQQ